MKLFKFDANDNMNKSDKLKLLILFFSIPIGIIVSYALACLNIDNKELQKNFFENISNPEMLFSNLFQILSKWYKVAIAFLMTAIVLLFIYAACNKKTDEDVFTYGQAFFISFVLILIYQAVLPLFSIIILIVGSLGYFLFFSSSLLKIIIEFLFGLFISFIEKICIVFGAELSYDGFIGYSAFSLFLTIITFSILIPYVFPLLLDLVEKVVQKFANSKLVMLFFKVFAMLKRTDILRYTVYLTLFFLSILTYSVNITSKNNSFSIIKEALVEFVLLDTIVYSIVSKKNDKIKSRERQALINYFLPIKYDLEFVLSVITMHNLRDKEMYARIKFSADRNTLPKKKGTKDISEIDQLLIEISTNYFEMDILEQKVKILLNRINNLIM